MTCQDDPQEQESAPGRTREDAGDPARGGGKQAGPRAQKVEPLRKPVPCPVCGHNSSRAEYPFCSNRCREVDLNRWLSGGYAIPSAVGEAEEAGEAADRE